MDNWFYILSDNLQNTSILEFVAVAFGLLSVWFAKRESIWVFPTGIVSVLIYVYICGKYGLYADMGVNGFYFIMSVYGWYNWTHKNGKVQLRPIARTTFVEKIYLTASFIFFFILIRYVLINYTDSSVPNIDALTTAIFLVGMWLMSLKKIENWTLWIIGDFISIPLYAYKGLVLTSVQYFIFLIIAVLGYLAWRKTFKTIQGD